MHHKSFRAAPLAAAALLACATLVQASSHREAPFITTSPKVDASDFYMFNSYEGGRGDYVTLIANYQPLQDAYGGPNYFKMDPNALYEIHIDNNGDAREDLTFQFRFQNAFKAITLPIGNQIVPIPLTQAGQVSCPNAGALNVNEKFTLNVVRGDRRTGTVAAVTDKSSGSASFDKPSDNIGVKTIPDYAGYAAQHIYTVNIPGCPVPAKVFVGQRQEAFAVNLGVIFDLVNAPVGVITDPTLINVAAANSIQDKNVTTLALEVHKQCLKQPNQVGRPADPVIGGWTTASVRANQTVSATPPSGYQTSTSYSGDWVQVSRLGMPLVNEVVIGLKDKDKFNSSKPKDDAANFADYVTHPTLPALIQILFPSAPAPSNFPRTDLMTAFLTGLPTVNRPSNITALGVGGPLAEMLRLNTSIPAQPITSQNPLGVAAGDAAGFPNGRRLGDDVVDVSLRVAMGALCTLTGSSDALKVGCKPADAPAGAVPFVDGVRANATDFKAAFPYLNTPLSGAKNF